MKSNQKHQFILLSCLSLVASFKMFASSDSVPSAPYPTGDDQLTFFVGAAYTFWQPSQGATNLAYSSGTSTVSGQVYAPSFDAQSGFKVCLGANVDHDSWNLIAQYTWFYNNPSMKVIGLPLDASSIVSNLGSQGEIFGLQGRFKNQFNRIDAILDRPFYSGQYLALRPFIGLLGAWDTQNFQSDTQADGVTITFDRNTQSNRNSQLWWGVGPYSGIKSSYYLIKEWAICFSSGVALLYTGHNVHEESNTYGDMTPLAASQEFNIKESLNAVEPVVESSLGLSWEPHWKDFALRLELAWELQYYFGHSGFEMFPVRVLEDYSMQGLTVGLTANF
jgi:hypothetical protein